jgi:predicted phage terminase large subunit-like protein
VGLDPSGYLYLLDVWLAKAPPTVQVSQIFNLNNLWHYKVFGIEANCFQSLLLSPIEEERKRRRDTNHPWQVPIAPVTHHQGKELRIATLEPLLANGWLRQETSLPEEFWQQIEAFPHAEHDDALDALEGAVTLVRSLQTLPAKPPKRFPRESIAGMAAF